MGQYYECVNLDTGEFIKPHDYEQGAKLMEHSWTITSFMKVAENLLKPGGEWYKTRIVWAGDYMDEGVFLKDTPQNVQKDFRLQLLLKKEEELPTLYSLTYDYFTALTGIEQNEETGFVYILNHNKKEFVDMTTLPVSDTWVSPTTGEEFKYYAHPLSILTSSGNGRGGGDYRYPHGEEYIGSWAGDIISLEKEKPEGFQEIKPDFRETDH